MVRMPSFGPHEAKSTKAPATESTPFDILSTPFVILSAPFVILSEAKNLIVLTKNLIVLKQCRCTGRSR